MRMDEDGFLSVLYNQAWWEGSAPGHSNDSRTAADGSKFHPYTWVTMQEIKINSYVAVEMKLQLWQFVFHKIFIMPTIWARSNSTGMQTSRTQSCLLESETANEQLSWHRH